MARYALQHDQLNGLIEEVKKKQAELVRDILYDNGRCIGGMIGSVNGENGHYDLESICLDVKQQYMKSDDGMATIVCHLNYPAFEADANYDYLSLDERQQIVELLIKEAQSL